MLELVLRPFRPSDLLAVEAAITEDRGLATVLRAPEADPRTAAAVAVGRAIAAEAVDDSGPALPVHHAVTVTGVRGAVGGVLYDRDAGCEVSVWINPRLRGQGIGASALRSWCEMLEANGATKLTATVPPNDEAAARLAGACGFRSSAEVPNAATHEVIRLSTPGEE